ncbi:MAG TPA: sigma-54 dependent transcriptional regulator [Planctomycetota bacterium]|nr:sigma-54 dependent transcriptional regulator [Planctomycetota bacterium]
MDSGWSALVIDDDPGIRQSVRLCLEADQARVVPVGTLPGALEILEHARFDVVFLDLWLGSESGLAAVPEILRRQPGVGIVVITAYASYETAVEAIKRGAVDYLPKPFTPEQVRHAARRVVSAHLLKQQVVELQDRVSETDAESCFETRSPRYRTFLETAERAAASDCTILLSGESGTGKNVLARRIRSQSKRKDRPFVTVLCPMLSGELLTSALFGHRKGAFTGAVTDALGKVDEAEGGTLFLDEVSELTPDAQARLLRFLNDQTYERLGETKERKADVRIIAASNRPLDQAVAAGRFREDLFFRLNVVNLLSPPLRERREDILHLVNHYLSFFGRRQGRDRLTLSPGAEQSVQDYRWPGNLRELRNAVERAAILAQSSVLSSDDLAVPPSLGEERKPPSRSPALGDPIALDDIEREHIARVVAHADSFESAAKALGIDASTLQRKRKRYGLA